MMWSLILLLKCFKADRLSPIYILGCGAPLSYFLCVLTKHGLASQYYYSLCSLIISPWTQHCLIHRLSIHSQPVLLLSLQLNYHTWDTALLYNSDLSVDYSFYTQQASSTHSFFSHLTLPLLLVLLIYDATPASPF